MQELETKVHNLTEENSNLYKKYKDTSDENDQLKEKMKEYENIINNGGLLNSLSELYQSSGVKTVTATFFVILFSFYIFFAPFGSNIELGKLGSVSNLFKENNEFYTQFSNSDFEDMDLPKPLKNEMNEKRKKDQLKFFLQLSQLEKNKSQEIESPKLIEKLNENELKNPNEIKSFAQEISKEDMMESLNDKKNNSLVAYALPSENAAIVFYNGDSKMLTVIKELSQMEKHK